MQNMPIYEYFMNSCCQPGAVLSTGRLQGGLSIQCEGRKQSSQRTVGPRCAKNRGCECTVGGHPVQPW